MDPRIVLCAHLAGDALAALPVEPDDAIEWHDGPIVAVVRCGQCGAAGLLELLDWGHGGRVRVFSLAGIAPSAVALWRRNAERGSCDPTRREREVEALLASAGPAQRLVARETASGAVLRSVPWPSDRVPPTGDWRERVASCDDAGWFAPLALARHA